MAIILLGLSDCALCGKILQSDDDVTGLPAASEDVGPLYPYFDCGFHTACYEAWDQKAEIERILVQQQKDYEESDYYKEMYAKYGPPKYKQ